MRSPISCSRPSGWSSDWDCSRVASLQLGESSPVFRKRVFNIFASQFIATFASMPHKQQTNPQVGRQCGAILTNEFYNSALIRVVIRCFASADIPLPGKSPRSDPSFGAVLCRKLICSKYRRHQAQIAKCNCIFIRILNVSDCSRACDVSRDISAQLGV